MTNSLCLWRLHSIVGLIFWWAYIPVSSPVFKFINTCRTRRNCTIINYKRQDDFRLFKLLLKKEEHVKSDKIKFV